MVKNEHRSTMRQNKLNSLILKSIEHELLCEIDITCIINKFAVGKSRKCNLKQNEDLRSALRELQFTNDYTYNEKASSEVYAEVYGLKHPAITVYNLKEDYFWPFVISDKWDNCSSLRITEGSLFTSLTQTYRELEKKGYICRFTTSVYENVLIPRGRSSCLKRTAAAPSADSGSSSSKTNGSGAEPFSEERTKITFTYFGTSPEQLHKILVDEGFDGVSVTDIFEQNHGSTPPPTPISTVTLADLCSRLPLNDSCSVVELVESTKNQKNNRFLARISGEEQKAFSRQFVRGSVEWSENHGDGLFQRKSDHKSILNPLNRHLLLEKKHARRQKWARKSALYNLMKQAFETTSTPYERWWVKEHTFVNPPNIMECGQASSGSPEMESYVRVPSDSLSSSDQTRSSRKSGGDRSSAVMKKMAKNGTKKAISDEDLIFVPKIADVDTWMCHCDICSGGLLFLASPQYQPFGIDKSNPLFRRRQQKLESLLLQNEESNRQDEVKQPPETVETKKTKKSTNHKNDFAATGKRGPKQKHKLSMPSRKSDTKDKQAVTRNSKKSPGFDIWWKTVSSYTTPYWQKENKKQDSDGINNSPFEWYVNCPQEIEVEEGAALDARKLKLTYSFDRMKERKQLESERARQKMLDQECGDGRPQTSSETPKRVQKLL